MAYGSNWRAPKVDVHQFAMIPRASIPRSTFRMQSQHKTTFSASQFVPVYVQEILPGDSFNVSMTAFVRMATPLYPIMDNCDLESFFFFVPNRLVWSNWAKFMGQQDNPGDSTSYVIPQIVSPAGGFPAFSVYDYFGLPTVGQVAGSNQVSISALPLRAYGLCWNEWMRDENLMSSQTFGASQLPGLNGMDNGPDLSTQYGLLTVQKRHDYFTSALPWTQKGPAITLPLGTSATVRASGTDLLTGIQTGVRFLSVSGAPAIADRALAFGATAGSTGLFESTTSAPHTGNAFYPTNLYADLSTATAATINALRLAFQTQKLLERDARGGTRLTEIIRSHFGVVSPDARQQRPEYLGGGKSPVNISPVPQTTPTYTSGPQTPLGTLSAVGTGVMRNHGYRQSFTEHGHVIGCVCVRSDPVYQQGIRRMWSRSTRYDFFWPVFSMLGEQSILNKEIYADGSTNDSLTFGYIPRWDEYRYHPSYTSGYFRSTTASTLDSWHLAQRFLALPQLNQSFVIDATAATLYRNLAAGTLTANQQFLCDLFFDERVARPLPMHSVPGLIDHF